VVHAAGVYADRLIRNHEPALFADVFRPKVDGAWNLHLLTLGDPLELFILCSSAASMLSAAGLANYAAANAFLDGLAHFRAAQSMPALSVNWGPWHGVGMADAVGDRWAAQWLSHGISAMGADEALAALETLVAGGAVQAGVFRLAGAPEAGDPGESPPDMRSRLADVPGSERLRAMIALVRDTVADKLGYRPAASLPLREGFFQIGMDSLVALGVLNSLGTSVGVHLPQTTVFAYPDVEALARHLLDLMFPAQSPVAVSPRHAPPEEERDATGGFLREIEEVEALLRATSV
jgi:hypothetical protein